MRHIGILLHFDGKKYPGKAIRKEHEDLEVILNHGARVDLQRKMICEKREISIYV